MSTSTKGDDIPILYDEMSFEDLRKRARQLESEIDIKLVSFSKLAANYGSSSSNERDTDSEKASLLSGDQM